VDDSFSQSYVRTIGIDLLSRCIDYGSQKIRLQIWDVAGYERFKPKSTNHYRSTKAIMFCFDLTQPNTFMNLTQWIAEADKFAPLTYAKVLVGTKSDLTEERQVLFEKAKQFADSFSMPYIETSAKYSENVDQAFKLVTEEIIRINFPDGLPDVEENTKQPKPKIIRTGCNVCTCF